MFQKWLEVFRKCFEVLRIAEKCFEVFRECSPAWLVGWRLEIGGWGCGTVVRRTRTGKSISIALALRVCVRACDAACA